MTEITKITHDLLRSWGPCSDGYKRFCELFPDGADLKTAMDGLIADGHDSWSYWLFERSREYGLFKDIVSLGYRNSGYWNSGNWNSGDWNSGNRNSGDWNSGYRNSGNWNSGDWNSGNWNSGDWNSGYWNSGFLNSGNWNSGSWNSGNWNSGNWNSGNWNSGNMNSGNWNSGNWNSGFLNTITPDELLIFNKLCKRDEWDKAYKPRFMFFDVTYWVNKSDMSDADKIADPHFHIRGGQLRCRGYKEAWKHAWDNADPVDRLRIKELPNFDADVFFEISGIDLRGESK